MSKQKDISTDLLRGRPKKLAIEATDEEAGKVIEKVIVPQTPASSSSAKKAEEDIVVPEQELVRTTMDLPRSLHTAIKIKSAQDQVSLKDYIVNLVKKDLNLE